MEHALHLAVTAAQDQRFNPNNLECFWYAAWNIILIKLYPKMLITPQLSLIYLEENRDNNNKKKWYTPDFIVSGYKKQQNGNTIERKYLLVENKRACDNEDRDKKMREALEQLKEQIGIVFLDEDYESIFGVISVGRYWKFYKYRRNNDSKKVISHNDQWEIEAMYPVMKKRLIS